MPTLERETAIISAQVPVQQRDELPRRPFARSTLWTLHPATPEHLELARRTASWREIPAERLTRDVVADQQ